MFGTQDQLLKAWQEAKHEAKHDAERDAKEREGTG